MKEFIFKGQRTIIDADAIMFDTLDGITHICRTQEELDNTGYGLLPQQQALYNVIIAKVDSLIKEQFKNPN